MYDNIILQSSQPFLEGFKFQLHIYDAVRYTENNKYYDGVILDICKDFIKCKFHEIGEYDLHVEGTEYFYKIINKSSFKDLNLEYENCNQGNEGFHYRGFEPVYEEVA